jgi:hypothetical protein
MCRGYVGFGPRDTGVGSGETGFGFGFGFGFGVIGIRAFL